jgi:hypothetical protein
LGGGGEQLLLAEAVVAVNVSPRQHHVDAVSGVEVMDGAQRLELPVAANVQVEVPPTPCLHVQAARSSLCRGASPGVELDPQPDGAVEHGRRADELLSTGRRVVAEIGARTQRQGVGHGQQAGRAAQLGDQDGGVGLVPLASLDDLLRRHGERTAPGGVEQPAEQRLGVKARKAQPQDAPVEADQRRRRAVTDQAHVLEREIAIAPEHPAKRWISVKHGCSPRYPD